MSSPVGIIIPNIWKNKTCLKPPTRYTPLSPSSHGFSPPARTASLALGRFGAEGVVAFVKHSGETFGQFTFGMFLKLTHVEVLVLHLEIYTFELSNCVNSCDSLTLPMNLGCQPMAIIRKQRVHPDAMGPAMRLDFPPSQQLQVVPIRANPC